MAMKILITGGAGFLGRRLAQRLLERGRLVGPHGQPERLERIVLLDQTPAPHLDDARVQSIVGDIRERDVLARAMGDDTDSVFHLAAVVSGEAEADFDLGMQVNLVSTNELLETCRHLPRPPRFVFASSVAVFGGALPAVVQDHTALNPQSSYGTQKAIGELLVSDYSRRGFIDGRALRLPTIVIRPGRPNRAASSFASSIVREPLCGRVTVCPVAAATRLWVMSPRQAIESLLLGHDLPAAALGDQRSINLPGLTVSVAEMVAGIERVAGPAVTDLIRWEYDPTVDRIVSSWPAAFDTVRARQLGFCADADFESIIRAYVADEGIVLPGVLPGVR